MFPIPSLVFEKRVANRIINWFDKEPVKIFEYLVEKELTEFSEPIRSVLHSFIVDLAGYEEGTKIEKRDFSAEWIFRRSIQEGPSFAKWLDGFKAYALMKMTSREYLDPEIKNSYQGFKTTILADCVGDIYRSNFLFNWEPPKIDIREYCMDKPEIEEEYLNEFRAHARIVLSDPRIDLLLPINDYKFFNKDDTKSCNEGANWKTKCCKPSAVRGKTVIVGIPRELKEQRCACIEDSSSIMTIRMIESNVKQILSIMKKDGMHQKPGTISAEYGRALGRVTKNARKKGASDGDLKYSYCRDFQKEGLTKPRVLMDIMMEELYDRCPRVRVFEYKGFFSNWTVEQDGEKIITERGHGLGMGNALTTLMQIIIESIVSEKSGTKPFWSKYYNDDAATVFNDRSHMERYSAYDEEVCLGLGLKFKKKATFYANGSGVMCEQYVSQHNPNLNNKSCFDIMSAYNLFKCINTSHARSIASSMNINGIPKNLLKKVIAYWGYVLFRSEQFMPIEVGGWFRSIISKVDLTFFDKLSYGKLNKMQEAAYYSYGSVKIQYKPWTRFNKPSKLLEVLPKEYLEQRNADLTVSPKNRFRATMDPKENTRAWRSFEKKLQEKFSNACKKSFPKTWEEVYKKYSEERPNMDILPPRDLVREGTMSCVCSTDDLEMYHPYSSKRNDIDYNLYQSDTPSEYTRKMNMSSKIILKEDLSKNGSMGRAMQLRTALGIEKVPKDVYNSYVLPDEESCKHWHDPFSVSYAIDKLTKHWMTAIPNWDPEKKMELLNKRSSIYGRDLTVEEWLLIGTVPPNDQVVLMKTKAYWNDSERNLNEIVNLIRKNPGMGQTIANLECHKYKTISEKIETYVNMYEKFIEDKTMPSKERFVKIYKLDVPNKVNDIISKVFDRKSNFFFDIKKEVKRWDRNADLDDLDFMEEEEDDLKPGKGFRELDFDPGGEGEEFHEDENLYEIDESMMFGEF